MTCHVGGDPTKALRVVRGVLGGCLLALTLLALPSAASAQCQPLPGRSALDQYCESVPGAGGDKAAGQDGGGRQQGGGRSRRAGQAGGGGSSGSSLPPGVASRLRRAGPNGQALLDYAKNSSGGDSGGKAGRGSGGRGDGKGPEADSSGNPLSAIKNALTSGPSAGQAYLWVLILVALILAVLGWLRYRSKHRVRAE